MLLNILKKPFVLVLAFLGYGCFPLPAQRGEFTEAEFHSMSLEMASPQVSLLDPSEVKTHYKILDTREEKEFQISHIDKATLVGYDDFNLDKIIKEFDYLDTIVVYCSVGYRSGKIGEKLQKAGFKNVYNLQGGLFRWANEQKPLIDDRDTPTHKVHGFNKKWAKWLKKEIPAVF